MPDNTTLRTGKTDAKPAAPAAPAAGQRIDFTFTGPITTNGDGGWACVVVPGSRDFFGTGKAVKVAGTLDGHPFQATMLPVGGGTHMLPLRAALRKAIGKQPGDDVIVHLQQRFT